MAKIKVGLVAFDRPHVKQSILKLVVQGTYLMSNVELPIPMTRFQLITGPTQKSIHKVVFDQRQLPMPINQANYHLGEAMGISTFVERMILVIDTFTPEVQATLQYMIKHFGSDNIRIIYQDHLLTLSQYQNQLEHQSVMESQVELQDTIKDDQDDMPDQKSPDTASDKPATNIVNNSDGAIDAQHCLKSPNGSQLFPYQQQMVNFVLEKKRAGLFVDMGLGKTFATLATIDYLASHQLIDATKPILIVAPKMVALDTWSREADKWGYDMDVKINIELGKKKREDLLDTLLHPQSKVTLLTTNPEQLKPMRKYFNDHQDSQPFSMVVVDELSQYKGFNSQRFKMLRTISEHMEYFIGLTGTPNPNNLLDLWSQLIAIDPHMGNKIGHSYYQYRGQFFKPDIVGRDGTVYSYRPQANAKDKIYQAMQSNVISMLSDGLVDLPKITYDNHYFDLPKKAQTMYNRLDTDLRAKLNESNGKQQSYEANGTKFGVANTATLASRLMQVTSGAVYDGVEDLTDDIVDNDINVDSQHFEVIHNRKLDILADLIDNATSPLLVFFQYKSELIRMRERFGDDIVYLDPSQTNVTRVIADWNAGKIPVLVAHPAAAGHGLNLQDGGHIMIWYTTTWSNEQYRQAIKRLYRRGQKYPVAVIHLVAKGTIDEEVVDRLNEKELQQQDLMKSLQQK